MTSNSWPDGRPERPTRQQTLRNTVTWSYQLLPSDLQCFLRQLGVFSGEFDLDAVSAVAADATATRSTRSTSSSTSAW